MPHIVCEVKNSRDKALALQVYARQTKNVEAEQRACEIRLRAERKSGELTGKLNKSNPGKRQKDLGSQTKLKSEVLEEAGISKNRLTNGETGVDPTGAIRCGAQIGSTTAHPFGGIRAGNGHGRARDRHHLSIVHHRAGLLVDHFERWGLLHTALRTLSSASRSPVHVGWWGQERGILRPTGGEAACMPDGAGPSET